MNRYGFIVGGLALGWMMCHAVSWAAPDRKEETMSLSSPIQDEIKEPNVAGVFYPDDENELKRMITTFLNRADSKPAPAGTKILIVPHAGYVYSGPVAAYGFKALAGRDIRTVIVLAPTHYYRFDRVSIWPKGGLMTPLGVCPVHERMATELMRLNREVVSVPQLFEQEHSLEVELPFIQTVFPQAKIVPLILGQLSPKQCQRLASSLAELIGDSENVFVVVSSDWSHYHDGPTARQMDARSLDAVVRLDAEAFYQGCSRGTMEACGFVPITTAVYLARLIGATKAEVLHYAHSGDVTSDDSRVVGYASVIFYRPEGKGDTRSKQAGGVEPLNDAQKRLLLDIARKTVESVVREGTAPRFEVRDARLLVPEGAFVTLRTKDGRLRGCIGHIVSDRPLVETVREMAVAAATQDPRFPPVRPDELEDLEVEVSVLSRPWRIKDPEEFIPGVHGVIVRRGGRSGVFLPQVADETGWGREEFLSQLCASKAGLPPDCWKDPQTELYLFTADVFSESDQEKKG